MKTTMSRNVALSMSRSVKELFSQTEFTARVLGVFDRACNLVTPDGEVVALVVSEIGDGPFNIVIDGSPAFFSKIKTDTSVTLTEDQLQLGSLQIDLRDVAVWEPQPDWDTLQKRQTVIVSRLPFLCTMCHHHAPDNTFLNLLIPPRTNEDVVFSIARSAGEILQDGWAGDQNQLRAAGKKLAGLGSGLTPAGDDFLCGVMLWAWLAHPNAAYFCRTLLDVAAPHTTTLSVAFLRAAANGECSQPWHTLLTALNTKDEFDIEVAVQKVLAHGATSGADTLAGFLYLSGKNKTQGVK